MTKKCLSSKSVNTRLTEPAIRHHVGLPQPQCAHVLRFRGSSSQFISDNFNELMIKLVSAAGPSSIVLAGTFAAFVTALAIGPFARWIIDAIFSVAK